LNTVHDHSHFNDHGESTANRLRHRNAELNH